MAYTLIILSFLITILLIIQLFTKVSQLEGRIKGLQYTLDQLTRQAELPENPVNIELRLLIEKGEDIEAVKKAREILGLSLLDGKAYIDKLKAEGKGNHRF